MEIQEEIIKSIEVKPVSGRTYLTVVVVDKKESANNKHQSVPCKQSVAFTSGYAYDRSSDSYFIACAEYLDLGSVPYACEISMPTGGKWRLRCPLPESVLQKLMSVSQRKMLQQVNDRYRNDRYEIQILQMHGSHD